MTKPSTYSEICLPGFPQGLPQASPRAILFDWDNTLVNSWPTIHAGLVATFEHMGHEPWTLEDVKAGRGGIHRSLRESFPEIFGDRWEEAKRVYHEHFAVIHLDNLLPFEGATDILRFLSEKDIFVGVVSNKTGKYLRKEVTFLGWDNYFSAVVGALDASRDKPDAAPIHLALEETDIHAGEHVWFVGDSQTDVDCALNAGCTPILLGQGAQEVGKGVYHMRGHNDMVQWLAMLQTPDAKLAT